MPKHQVPRSKTVTYSGANTQTDTHTEVLITESYRGSAFQASAYNMSGPICIVKGDKPILRNWEMDKCNTLPLIKISETQENTNQKTMTFEYEY